MIVDCPLCGGPCAEETNKSFVRLECGSCGYASDVETWPGIPGTLLQIPKRLRRFAKVAAVRTPGSRVLGVEAPWWPVGYEMVPVPGRSGGWKSARIRPVVSMGRLAWRRKNLRWARSRSRGGAMFSGPTLSGPLAPSRSYLDYDDVREALAAAYEDHDEAARTCRAIARDPPKIELIRADPITMNTRPRAGASPGFRGLVNRAASGGIGVGSSRCLVAAYTLLRSPTARTIGGARPRFSRKYGMRFQTSGRPAT